MKWYKREVLGAPAWGWLLVAIVAVLIVLFVAVYEMMIPDLQRPDRQSFR